MSEDALDLELIRSIHQRRDCHQVTELVRMCEGDTCVFTQRLDGLAQRIGLDALALRHYKEPVRVIISKPLAILMARGNCAYSCPCWRCAVGSVPGQRHPG